MHSAAMLVLRCAAVMRRLCAWSGHWPQDVHGMWRETMKMLLVLLVLLVLRSGSFCRAGCGASPSMLRVSSSCAFVLVATIRVGLRLYVRICEELGLLRASYARYCVHALSWRSVSDRSAPTCLSLTCAVRRHSASEVGRALTHWRTLQLVRFCMDARCCCSCNHVPFLRVTCVN